MSIGARQCIGHTARVRCKLCGVPTKAHAALNPVCGPCAETFTPADGKADGANFAFVVIFPGYVEFRCGEHPYRGSEPVGNYHSQRECLGHVIKLLTERGITNIQCRFV
jgi:hypothetical protein